ncbi:acyl-CoA dehydrogenase family protein [Pseudonocardia pini]|uniref:acyl-CoA dehydrogenase family protein n=1 Tax=Pseudonocardia pini TaxID=2758030 RepID=UPI0015F04988|nr:acyl-CoA dehydrogenase family protein [Pseudonocardia pini]
MSYCFTLSKALRDHTEALREWSTTECRPYARQADIDKRRPDNWREILDTAPIALGRSDREEPDPLPEFEEGEWVSKLAFYEAINYGDVWVHPTLGGGIGHLVVKSMGTPVQIERWYDPIEAGGSTTGFALTEPGFGSDTSQVTTTATRDGDSWVINGSKMYCTGGAFAEYVVVFATVDKTLGAKGITAFVVPRDTPGFVVAKENEDKLGIRSWTTSELFFDDCAVPLENRLGWGPHGAEGAPGNGQGAALGALAFNRPNMSALGIGLAQASIDVATPILKSRRAGFTPQRWSAIEHDLEAMNAALDRGRRLNYLAQGRVDAGAPSRSLSAAAKGYVPETGERIIRRCMELLGPEGSSKELLLEKWYRDSKIIDIFEGSGQVQRIMMGRSLVGRLAG